MAGAQFVGKKNLISAFERRGGGTWQIAQGKKICHKGSGSADLEEWIDIFGAAQSRSPYTLHMYDGLEPDEIGKNAPDASWDFTISDAAPQAVGAVSGTASVVSRLQQKIDDRIAEKIGALLEKDDEPPEEPVGIDLNRHLDDYIANPHKLVQAIGAVQQVFGMLKNFMGGGGAATQPAAAIGSIPGQQQSQPAEYPDGTYERLAAVLDKLQQRDPKLLQHLEKLAALDDLTFTLILSKLDAL